MLTLRVEPANDNAHISKVCFCSFGCSDRLVFFGSDQQFQANSSFELPERNGRRGRGDLSRNAMWLQILLFCAVFRGFAGFKRGLQPKRVVHRISSESNESITSVLLLSVEA